MRKRVHRAADIHEKEHANVRLARRTHDDLEFATVFCRLVDGVFDVEFMEHAFALEGSQLAQGDFDLANVEHDVASIRLVDARIGNGHGAASSAATSYAN